MSKIPPLPSHKGHRKTIKDIYGKSVSFTVIDEITHKESGNPEKAFYLQKLKWDNGKIGLRLCYFMIGKKPRMRGKWAYAQSAPMISPADLRSLLVRAKKQKFF